MMAWSCPSVSMPIEHIEFHDIYSEIFDYGESVTKNALNIPYEINRSAYKHFKWSNLHYIRIENSIPSYSLFIRDHSTLLDEEKRDRKLLPAVFWVLPSCSTSV
jgi:hypothetical protein